MVNNSSMNILTNTSNSTSTNIYSVIINVPFLGYYSLLMIIIGTVFNLLTFIILCQPAFRDTKVRPTLHYMRALALIDLINLYGWNLDNYLQIVHGFTLNDSYTVASCKFFTFLNYVTLHISGWLRIFICFDRYLCLSRVQPNTWFNRSKSVLIIIFGTTIFFMLFNLHLLIFVCYRNDSGQIVRSSKLYPLYPIYNQINLVLYNGIPLFFMVLFNSMSIYHLIRLRYATIVQNSRIRHRAISITIISTTFLFFVTGTPSSISYSFFYGTLAATVTGRRLMNAFAAIGYTFPVLSFPIYLITFSEFRRATIGLVMRNREIQPVTNGTRQAHMTNMELQHKPNTHRLK
ncbi:unnamed protein product [Adineta steineri]|uniref:G-protein coupled receptors family 1 profile domain-containing protein n=2 Tax=Adineta steineri TaxID=433720 RepID=A0A815KVF3_9BILA|nr:unnamed protein product [Adineta steineri]